MVKVRPGRYAVLEPDLSPWEQRKRVHLERARGRIEAGSDACAVLQTAVLMHGGSLRFTIEQAHINTNSKARSACAPDESLRLLTAHEHRLRLDERSIVHHCLPIADEEIVEIEGIRVTNLPTTILHAARFLRPDESVIAVDSLLAVAIGRSEDWRNDRHSLAVQARDFLEPIIEALAGLRGRRGVAQARWVLGQASPFAESPLESNVRRIAFALGHSDVEAQLEVATDEGMKWCDIGIARVKTVWESNGEVKYVGEDGPANLLREARRRQALERSGYRVVDLTSAQSWDTAHLAASLATHAPHALRQPVVGLLTRAERLRLFGDSRIRRI